jgi:HPt (histidine-containing phosphotransfer) domain-containing protein
VGASFGAIESAVASGRAAEATRAAHALKGTAGNLSIADVFAEAKEIEVGLPFMARSELDASVLRLRAAVGVVCDAIDALEASAPTRSEEALAR